jgi:hypothetical protein
MYDLTRSAGRSTGRGLLPGRIFRVLVSPDVAPPRTILNAGPVKMIEKCFSKYRDMLGLGRVRIPSDNILFGAFPLEACRVVCQGISTGRRTYLFQRGRRDVVRTWKGADLLGTRDLCH